MLEIPKKKILLNLKNDDTEISEMLREEVKWKTKREETIVILWRDGDVTTSIASKHGFILP